MALRWKFLLLLTPLLAAQEQEEPDPDDSGEPSLVGGRCKAPSDWDPKLQFTPNKSSYALNDLVQLSCAGEYVPSVPRIRCISSGTQTLWNGTATCKERCQKPQWDSRLRFTPNQSFYGLNEELTLSCFMEDSPPLAVIRCAKGTSPGWKNVWEVKNAQGTWHGMAEKLTCSGKCLKPKWDERLQFSSNRKNYQYNEELTLTCPGDLKPSFPKVKCAKEFLKVHSGKPFYGDAWWGRSSTGAWMIIERVVRCIETCQRPQWDTRLQLTPDQENYEKNEEVLLRCPEGFQPSFTEIKCWGKVQPVRNRKPAHTDPWFGRNSRDDWIHIQSDVECIETCQRPQWDARLQLTPDQENYKKNEEVMLSCPEDFQPSFTHVKCLSEVQSISYRNPVHRAVWHRRDSRGGWIHIWSSVECIETCQRPQWDTRLQLAPDQENYKKNEEVMLSCPEGFQPSFTHVKCLGEDQPTNNWNPVYRDPWLGRDSRGGWIRIQSSVECIGKGGIRSRMVLCRGEMLGMCLRESQHGKVMVFPGTSAVRFDDCGSNSCKARMKRVSLCSPVAPKDGSNHITQRV